MISDLTLDKAISIARAAEQQQKHAKSVKQEVIEIDRAYTEKSKGQASQKVTQKTALRGECPRCGLTEHRNDVCPAKNSRCRSCKKLGHWDKECRTKAVNCTESSSQERADSPVNAEAQQGEYFLGHVSHKQEDDDFAEEVFLEGCPRHIEFLIDTGADVTCIRASDVPVAFGKRIKPTNARVTGPDGVKLQLLGNLSVKAKIRGVTKEMSLYVIRDLNRHLLGKDSIKAFE